MPFPMGAAFALQPLRSARLPDDVRLWRIDLDLEAPLCASVLDVLDGAERMRLERYRRHADRVRFGVTRAVLRRLLGHAVRGVAPAQIRLADGARGKPFWRDGALAFNVAHSGSRAYIALSARRAVGVDVEWRDPALALDELAPLALTAGERALLDGLAPARRRQGFFDLWVCKEALLKGAGWGIGTALQDFSVCPQTWAPELEAAVPASAPRIAFASPAAASRSAELQAYAFQLFDGGADYAAALAYSPMRAPP